MASNGQAIKQEVFRLAPTRAATRKRKVGLGTPLPTQASGAQLLNKFFWLALTPTQARQDQSRTAIDGRKKLKKAIKRGTDPLLERALKQEVSRLATSRATTRKRKVGLGTPLPTPSLRREAS